MLSNKLKAIEYCPSLFLRPAEMRALEELPTQDKNRVIPLIFLRPWLTSKSFEKSLETVHRAFPDRQFFAELDPYYVRPNVSRRSVTEFNGFFDPRNAFMNWRAILHEVPTAIPVARLEGGSSALAKQIERLSDLERGIALRLSRDLTPQPHTILRTFLDAQPPDPVIIIDLGWSMSLLENTQWAISILDILRREQPDVPVIVSGSSFPENFSDLRSGSSIPLSERFAYNEAVRLFNEVRLIYGDWGSTRPPKAPTPMSTPVPRIDLPTRDAWAVFRAPADEGGYPAAASQAVESRDWPTGTIIWGTYLIRATADEQPNQISTAAQATAVRVNIHLHTQVNFSTFGPFTEPDEDFEEIL